MHLRLLYILITIPFWSFSQKNWTLEDCLKYALEHNLTIKQAELNTSLSKNLFLQSKMELLPSLSANISQSLNFGRNIDPYTNTFTLEKVRNNNFGSSTSVIIFSGFQRINNIRKTNYDYLASQYDSEKIVNDIAMNIISAFLQLMYSEEVVEIQKDKLELSKLQVSRISKMVEVGRLPKGNLLETESQMAQEELQLINVQNQKDISRLNIQQLLDLDASVPFNFEAPVVEVSNKYKFINSDSLYLYAAINLPDVKSANNKLKSSERAFAIAKGARSPILNIAGNIGTGYSDARQKIILESSDEVVYSEYFFNEQIEDNFNQSLSFNLSIPIFNRWQTNSSIVRAKIGVLQSQYDLQKVKNQLRKEIEQANADALAAHKKYLASQKSAEALKESFRYVYEKYEVDLVSTYEYNDAKNRLFQSEFDLLQAKYDYIFKIKILDFYTGNELTF